MSSTTHDWFTINDHGDLSGNGQVSIGSVPSHTGRLLRRKVADLETDGGGNAQIIVVQNPGAAYIQIAGVQDENGNTVSTIPAAGGTYYLVGNSNCAQLNVEETSNDFTGINDSKSKPQTGGFTLIDAGGSQHTEIPVGMDIRPDYGAAAAYEFKIPFIAYEHSGRSSRNIAVRIEDEDGTVYATLTVPQAAANLFIDIDHFENSGGTTVTSLASAAATYYAVGFANVNFITVDEASEGSGGSVVKNYTDLTSSSGLAWANGITIIEAVGQGTSHTGVALEQQFSYGTDVKYKFKIPFQTNANTGADQRKVGVYVQDDEVTAHEDTEYIYQAGSQAEEESPT